MRLVLALLSLSFGIVQLFGQQIDLTGQISIHNSRYRTGQIEYVSDAFVSAPFAGSTNTDSEGRFRLTFQSVGRGTTVRLSVEKAGLELVNRKELNEVVLGRIRPIQIFLAPKGQLAEAQLELYNISKSALLRRHKQQINLLRQANAQSDSLIQDLKHKLNTEIANRFEAEALLNQQLVDIQKRLPKVARQLSSVNLDFVSDMYRTAYEYIQSGEIELAIETLDEAKLDEEANKSIKQVQVSRAGLDSLPTAEQLNLAALDTLVRSQVLQARLFVQQKNYETATDWYRGTIQYLVYLYKTETNTRFEEYFAAARWSILNSDWITACALFEKALAVSPIVLPIFGEPFPSGRNKEENYLYIVRRIMSSKN